MFEPVPSAPEDERHTCNPIPLSLSNVTGISFAPSYLMPIDRRDKRRRQEVIRSVVDQIVRNTESRVTIESLRDLLDIPEDAARRIVTSLVSAGIVREGRPGVWYHALKFSMKSPSQKRPS